MIETPLGVLSVKEMCSEMELRERQGRFRRGTARPSLTTICMGFADLGKELHAPHVPGRLNIMTSAQLCVLAARAYGLMILDGVHLGA
jgi:citrate lyase subunit beta / citryl-CoA lyase